MKMFTGQRRDVSARENLPEHIFIAISFGNHNDDDDDDDGAGGGAA